jgi:pyruvate formate lyase activating enzyme
MEGEPSGANELGREPMKEAMLYERLADERVECHLCAHECRIAEGRKGICQVRENQDGTLYTLVYGRTIARHIDPVEKKPLFHFYPGSRAYSVATPGCNFRCQWCQNADISQMPRERHFHMGMEASPEQIVSAALQNRCRSIAYTYTEPTIFFEYSYDTARVAHDHGVANVYVTNGFMTEAMLETFDPHLDAANVDLKAFRDETYREYVGGRLQPVLDSLKRMKDLGIWLEVTTLVIPGVNDDLGELREIARFIAEDLGPETPWHISRFRPSYKMQDRGPTPRSTLRQAQQIGEEEGLRYIYLGNLPGESSTVCHQCGETMVRRSGYRVVGNLVSEDGRCPTCNTEIAGVGMVGTG